MSEDGERKTKTIAEMVGNYPAKDLPVIFADQAPVTSRQAGVVKFYLIRNDPSISADSTNNAQLVAQVVMPVGGFAATVTFFEDELNNLVAAGELKAELVEDARAFYRKRREEKDAVKS
jgi:hypothetical protein